MDQDELLARVVEVLERLELPYLITGSIATIFGFTSLGSGDGSAGRATRTRGAGEPARGSVAAVGE